jgi:uncharacterized protein YndB with AHSA1/START domain
MPAIDGTLHEHDGRPALRFERILRQPPERVWRALVDPADLAHWHPTPMRRLEPEVGGAVAFGSPPGVPEMPDGAVTAYDPPRLLGYTWGDDLLRWELEPHEDGSRLVLVHAFDDRFKAARDGAGWHLCLDALAAALDGEPARPGDDGTGLPPRWRELNAAYEQRFGIAPEDATPVIPTG